MPDPADARVTPAPPAPMDPIGFTPIIFTFTLSETEAGTY